MRPLSIQAWIQAPLILCLSFRYSMKYLWLAYSKYYHSYWISRSLAGINCKHWKQFSWKCSREWCLRQPGWCYSWKFMKGQLFGIHYMGLHLRDTIIVSLIQYFKIRKGSVCPWRQILKMYLIAHFSNLDKDTLSTQVHGWMINGPRPCEANP